MRRSALVAALLFAAACSGGSNGSSTSSQAPTSQVSSPSTSSAQPDFVASTNPTTLVTTTLVPQVAVKNVVTRSADAQGAGIMPEGVASVTARVTSAEGELCEVCLWLADDDASRQRGLMGVTDLGNAVGMAFVWEQPRTGNFFMFQTPTPLSIAWFDDTGAHVGQADMEPCLVDDSALCERYTADSPYVLAVEMFGGQLGAIGIGAGASIELLELPCV